MRFRPLRVGFARRGSRAERRAARHLRRSGYRVLGRNLRAGPGEIDLLAERRGLLVVVEVRYRRSGIAHADRSVTPGKVRLIHRTWWALRPRLRIARDHPVRFDLLLGDDRGAWTHLPGVLDPAVDPPSELA